MSKIRAKYDEEFKKNAVPAPKPLSSGTLHKKRSESVLSQGTRLYGTGGDQLNTRPASNPQSDQQ